MRKGPLKEKRHEPLVGLGLILDANQIPIGMKLYPEKEKIWVLLPNDYHEIKNVNDDVMYKIKECIDDFEYEIDDEKQYEKEG